MSNELIERKTIDWTQVGREIQKMSAIESERDQQAKAIADLTAENERLEAERAKLWNEKREAVSSCHVAQAAADALKVENERLRELLVAVDRRGLPDRYNSDAELQEQVTAALKGE